MSRIAIGTKKADDSLATVDAEKMMVHSVIFGQSGSGKSYFLARVVEEILLRTRARVVAIDPNGDFETFFAPRESTFWGPTKDQGKKLAKVQTKSGEMQLKCYDSKTTFTEKWKDIIFQHLILGREDRMPLRAKAYGAPVKFHWKYIPRNIQDFLLNIDPIHHPKVFQGIGTCYHYVDRNPGDYPSGVSLRDLEDIAMDFESRKIVASLLLYSDAMTLTPEDWHEVRMQFRMVRKSFGSVLYLNKIKGHQGTQASDVGSYLHRGFVEGIDSKPPWQFLSLGLAGAVPEHGLLSTYITLQRLWLEAVRAWREERIKQMKAVTKSVLPISDTLGEFESLAEETEPADQDIDSPDTPAALEAEPEETGVEYASRRPTFIVIDEAHNFVPEESDTPLQRKVSDLITTIAAEGRKYGLFLIISTQRPQKLRKGLIAECENLAVLKLQSGLERQYLVDNTSLEAGNEEKISTLQQGEVLLSGRWIGDTSVVSFAPARTFLGGTGIDPKTWLD